VAWSAGAKAMVVMAATDGPLAPPHIREGTTAKIPVFLFR